MISGKAQLLKSLKPLIGKGYDLRVYDSNVHLSSLFGKKQGIY